MRTMARFLIVILLALAALGAAMGGVQADWHRPWFSQTETENSTPVSGNDGVAETVGPDLVVSNNSPLWCAAAGTDFMQGMSMYLAGVMQPRSMVVTPELVIVPSQSEPLGLLAFDVSTGEEVWKADLGASSNLNTGLLAFLAPDTNQVIWMQEKGPLGAIDIETGAQQWSVTIAGLNPNPPGIDGTDLYVTAEGSGVVALDATSGAITWVSPQEAAPGPVMIADDTTVIAGLEGGVAVALDRSDGTELWRATVATDAADSSYGWGWNGAAADGIALLVNWEGEFELEGMALYAVDTRTGAVLWSREFDSWITAPAIADGVGFVGDGGGTVLAMDLKTGAEIWHREVSGSGFGEWGFYGPEPTIFGSTVVLPGFGGTEDGQTFGVAFAFDTATGASQWVVGSDQAQVIDTPVQVVDNLLVMRGLSADEGAPARVCAFDVGQGR